jgi:hypothetical protein
MADFRSKARRFFIRAGLVVGALVVLYIIGKMAGAATAGAATGCG